MSLTAVSTETLSIVLPLAGFIQSALLCSQPSSHAFQRHPDYYTCIPVHNLSNQKYRTYLEYTVLTPNSSLAHRSAATAAVVMMPFP